MKTFIKTFNVGEVAAGSRLEVDVENYNTVIVTLVGGAVAPTGFTCSYEASQDSTSKENGAWPLLRGQSSNSDLTTNSTTALGLAANTSNTSSLIFNVSAYKRFRVRATALTAGNMKAIITVAKETPSPIMSAVSISSIVPGNGATALGKAEDAAAANGDTGVAILGVRVPATPAAQTSAAGDYGTLAITSEGKQIISGQGAEEHQWIYWQAVSASATTAKAAVAGVRNMVTDVIVDNNTASSIRVTVLDGASVLFAVSVPANSNFAHSFKSPLRGSVNTAINVQGAAAAGNVHLSGYVSV